MRADLLLIAALTLCGCDRGPSPEALLIEGSRTVTMDSAAMLGPHRYEATTVRQWADETRGSSETFELDWGDWDHFATRRLRDGRLRAELRVIDGVAYVRQGDRFTRYDDAELHRGELRSTWSTWEQAMAPFAARLQLTEPEDAVVEGRPATRYRVSLAEGDAPDGDQRPLSLSGTVTLDQATAVRLLAEIEGRYEEPGGRRSPPREREVRFSMTRSGFGTPPTLETPKHPRGGPR
ncbi:MAG: hypothetical protein H6739_11425 [Alphaproteobacteria bacterium]|nr:hypothetical protein [Alphaproteobacteria bacterium]